MQLGINRTANYMHYNTGCKRAAGESDDHKLFQWTVLDKILH